MSVTKHRRGPRAGATGGVAVAAAMLVAVLPQWAVAGPPAGGARLEVAQAETAAGLVIEPRNRRMQALENATVRAQPGVEFRRLTGLLKDDVVTVTGKVARRDWYRIALAGGGQGFVWGQLLGEPAEGTEMGSEPIAAGYHPGDVFRDCSTCPEMVVMPPGSFQMGSSESELAHLIDDQGVEREWVADELPRHEVRIDDRVAVGKFEVTRLEFSAFAEATVRRPGRRCFVYNDGRWQNQPSRNWRVPGYTQDYREPVVCVSWNDAVDYLAWLRDQTGKGYRLLSEAEWEYAARAGTETRRYWGDDDDNDQGCLYANVSDLTRARVHDLELSGDNTFDCEDGAVRTARVGRYEANSFGLHDMLGNVWEWAEDCYHDSYSGAAGDRSARRDGVCTRRVLRGGSWDYDPRAVRAANRGWANTVDRSTNIGFRVALTLD